MDRLRAVHATGLLDSPPEELFDELAQLAAAVCETPISLVSLVAQDRQWFKARVGLDIQETSIESSFCRHALQHDELFIVPDTHLDPLFAQNALVLGAPFIRFYAGYPLQVPGGEKIGTLCVIDSKPRELQPFQIRALGILGRQVNAQLQMKQLVANLRTTERKKEEAIKARRLAETAAEKRRITTLDSVAMVSLELAKANARFRMLIESVGDHALLTVNRAGIVTSWNRGAERLLGYTEEQIMGRNVACFFTPEDRQRGVPAALIDQVMREGKAEDEGWRVRANGERFWALVSETAFLMEEGVAPDTKFGLAVVIKDMTERKRVAAALEETRQERMKLQERFLSNVSHELRTPLTAIYFFISNVNDGLLGNVLPEQQEQLQMALENVSQLKAMVADLLDITRVETMKLTIDPRRISARRMVMEVLTTCHQSASAKKLRLRSDLVKGLPCVWADPHRVRQILTNLIENAAKFTPQDGSIVVKVQEDPDNSAFLEFSVTDTGCGISPEHCGLVFNRLAQVENEVQSSRSGLGLGLFIARELVTQHGGRIWLKSEVGVGSSFFFTLPVFSLAGRCALIFTDHNFRQGYATLIAVDISQNHLHVGSEGTTDSLLEGLTQALAHCIHPAQDVVLPWMKSGPSRKTAFIVACTGAEGLSAITDRIESELKQLEQTVQLEPVLSSTTIRIASGSLEARRRIVGEVLEELIQKHLSATECLQ